MDNSVGIGDLAAIVTVAGVTIYVLGLVGLAITIRLAFTGDFSTAWYAVSLLPRTIVAGQGVRIWLRWPIISTAIVLPLALIVSALPGSESDIGISFLEWTLTLLAPGILYGVATVLKPRQASRRAQTRGVLSFLALFSWIYCGGFVLLVGMSIITAPEIAAPLAISNPFVIGGTLVFFGGFLLGIPAAREVDPPLPRVWIAEQPGINKGAVSNPIKGHLVTHSDGFWHLFDENNELLSIPDDRVSSVRVTGKTEVKRTGAVRSWWRRIFAP